VAKEDEVRAALEVIAGRKISPEVPVPLETFPPIFFYLGTAVSTLAATLQSFTIWGNLFGQTGLNNTSLVDLTGFASTGNDGKSVFRLTSLFQVDTAHPINVVATARGGVPASLTVDVDGDFQITVHSWDPQGNPAPNVMFDWRCRVAFIEP
jgi:hypothetical protein